MPIIRSHTQDKGGNPDQHAGYQGCERVRSGDISAPGSCHHIRHDRAHQPNRLKDGEGYAPRHIPAHDAGIGRDVGARCGQAPQRESQPGDTGDQCEKRPPIKAVGLARRRRVHEVRLAMRHAPLGYRVRLQTRVDGQVQGPIVLPALGAAEVIAVLFIAIAGNKAGLRRWWAPSKLSYTQAPCS